MSRRLAYADRPVQRCLLKANAGPVDGLPLIATLQRMKFAARSEALVELVFLEIDCKQGIGAPVPVIPQPLAVTDRPNVDPNNSRSGNQTKHGGRPKRPRAMLLKQTMFFQLARQSANTESASFAPRTCRSPASKESVGIPGANLPEFLIRRGETNRLSGHYGSPFQQTLSPAIQSRW
jgi:hypothetical protein